MLRFLMSSKRLNKPSPNLTPTKKASLNLHLNSSEKRRKDRWLKLRENHFLKWKGSKLSKKDRGKRG